MAFLHGRAEEGPGGAAFLVQIEAKRVQLFVSEDGELLGIDIYGWVITLVPRDDPKSKEAPKLWIRREEKGDVWADLGAMRPSVH